MTRLTVVLVHYRTPSLLASAVAALRTDLLRSGIEAELVVVDNGSDPADREGMRALAVHLIEPGRNLGYAGGLNLGATASSSDILVFMNCDVQVVPGCLAELSRALADGAAAAGPRFFWDHACTMVLPPADRRERKWELAMRAARFCAPVAASVRQRWRLEAKRHWLAERPIESVQLSGALLAIRRDVWEQVGPFDEGFSLYFEECDWLARLPAMGLVSLYVPSASAVHLFNQSAAREPRAARWYATSAKRFARRHYGVAFAELLSVLDKIAPGGRRVPGGAPEIAVDHAVAGAVPPLWVEVSPNYHGLPSAAARLDGQTHAQWKMPDDVLRGLASGRYTIRLVDDAGRELGASFFNRAGTCPQPEAFDARSRL